MGYEAALQLCALHLYVLVPTCLLCVYVNGSLVLQPFEQASKVVMRDSYYS